MQKNVHPYLPFSCICSYRSQQIWKALNYYDLQLSKSPTMIIGDFNSNTIWDKKHRLSNHSNVVRLLAEKNIFSTYHCYYKQEQGKEQHPTLYLHRHKNKPYHIDYCFVSIDLEQKIHTVEIGEFDYWTKYSDHVPVIVIFDLN